MNNALLLSIIFSVIIFSIIIVIIVLQYNLSPWLYFLQAIPIILGGLSVYYAKKCDCKVGNGEYNKSGGIVIPNPQLKVDLNNLTESIKRGDEKNVNKILLNNNWKECGTQEDPVEFLNALFKEIFDLNTGNPQTNHNFVFIGPQPTNISEIDNLYYNDLEKEYNIRGIILNIPSIGGSHYIAIVRYDNGWYECDDGYCKKLYTFLDDNEILDSLKAEYPNTIVRGIMYGKSTILYKQGNPFGLPNLGNTCYSNSAMQLLLSTELLDEIQTTITEPKPEGLISQVINVAKEIYNEVTEILTGSDKTEESKSNSEIESPKSSRESSFYSARSSSDIKDSDINEQTIITKDNTKLTQSSGLPVYENFKPEVISHYESTKKLKSKNKNKNKTAFDDYLQKSEKM